MGSWLGLRLVEPGPNRDAIGSWIEVRVGNQAERRELTIGGGHAGGQLGWIHFGLGNAERTQVRITWPNGETSDWMEVAANRFGTVHRGSSSVTTWQPGR